jgi:AcrR family transcriptional regulator
MVQTGQKIPQILDAALPVFVRYGFKKTSMADIAQAAGISRASLYLSFSNKEELFRAGSARAHENAMNQVISVLHGDGDVIARIEMAMMTFQKSLIVPFGSSTQAAELFKTNMELAADITLKTREKLLENLASHLSDAEQNGEINLTATGTTPKDLANMVVAVADGIKHMQGAGVALENGTRMFMRILREAITPSS